MSRGFGHPGGVGLRRSRTRAGRDRRPCSPTRQTVGMSTTHAAVSVPSEDRILAGTLVTAAAASGAAVLFVHGLGSSRMANVERAEAVSRRHSAICLAIDLGGHGGSTGRLTQMTPRHNLADVVAAYDRLASVPGVQPARIGLCAASYGAYLSVLLTALRPASRLLLRAPALYADDCFDRGLGQRRFGDPATASTCLAHLALFRGPVAIVESENDEVISRDIVAAFMAALPRADHMILAAARHALTQPEWRTAFERIVVEFFADL